MSNLIDSASFELKVKELVTLAELWMQDNSLRNYRYADSIDLLKNYAIYTVLKTGIELISEDSTRKFTTVPFVYDFEDFDGKKDWTKNFVSKLLYTYSGNCHSLPFLYKILADEMNALCWLSLAPNHIYIRNRAKSIGWYNTELTSGQFPIDAWITASGYIPVAAVQSGLYMDTLSNQQAIALCVLDLAKGYERQTQNYSDGFILKCCELVLKYHSVNPQALLLKAETLKKIYEKEVINRSSSAAATYSQMEKVYIGLYNLGYREMPQKMYLEWLKSMQAHQKKYGNGRVKELVKVQADIRNKENPTKFF